MNIITGIKDREGLRKLKDTEPDLYDALRGLAGTRIKFDDFNPAWFDDIETPASEAAKKKKLNQGGRPGTILTGGLGVVSSSNTARKKLLGQ